MLTIEKVDTNNKSQVNRFVRIPYQFYVNNPYWVPPLLMDAKLQLDRVKHPYYEHSDADFWIAVRDGKDVGRIAALENKPFNEYHHTRKGSFYLFECEDNQETANALFAVVFEWMLARGLDTVLGPKGFGVLDGYGLLVEGYDKRQIMTMMNYNPPYYVKMVEALGFEKEVDFVSCYIKRDDFILPERIYRIVERVERMGKLRVVNFENKGELRAWADRIGKAYNQAFVNNWEYYPLSAREIKFILDNIMLVADPKLIKVIAHGDEVVGFLLGFPDLSAALQRAKGHLFPFGLIDLLLEPKRTDWIALNGAGILPEFQGRGGNALLYVEILKNMKEGQFLHADLTQVAETAVQMRSDLVNVGGKMYKNHRVFRKLI